MRGKGLFSKATYIIHFPCTQLRIQKSYTFRQIHFFKCTSQYQWLNIVQNREKMSNQGKKKVQKYGIAVNNIKLPDINHPHQQRESSKSKEKGLTDPPALKKDNKKTGSNPNFEKTGQGFNRFAELFQKTQNDFTALFRHVLSLHERQEHFNAILIQQMQKSSAIKSMQYSASTVSSSDSSIQDIQYRDRFFYIDLPIFRKSGQWMDELKRWISKLFTKTFSVAFHHFSRNSMTFQQTKIYCSMNILYNIIKLNKNHSIKSQTIEELDKYLKSDVLVYLQKKYPLTQSQSINKSLENRVQQIDNLSALSNNYFSNSSVIFEYRQGGNYNDLIMRMLNDIISKIDEKSPFQINKKRTNFDDFKKYMTEIFQIVEEQDELESIQEQPVTNIIADFINDKIGRNMKSSIPQNGMIMKDSSKIRQIERQKYRSKVKQYTHYKIGRKIPQTVGSYSEKQIQSMNISIKHPTIFRILTKWCEELRRKFTTSGYFANYSDNIKVQKGNIVNSLLFPMRMALDEQLQLEQNAISEFLKSLSHSNYQMQRQLLQKQAARFEWYDMQQQQLEQVCGRYSIQMINSLNSFLITYLNRLIHGLMKVAKRFYEKFELSGNSNWPSPPNLLTFTLGDLMRCKISSKQKEVLRIYEQIRLLSMRFPQKMKLVRIKNRLNLSTNDILLNIRFNGLILCQIQLAVKTETSQFINCSNTFCHYLYELERSPFGSIAELCNIWAYLDRRAQIFKEKIQSQVQRQYLKRVHSCDPLSKRTQYEKPFICHTCDLAYYHNNYLRPHLQCLLCNHIICAKCQLKEENQGNIVQNLIGNKKLRKSIQYMINRLETSSQVMENDLPQFGVCIYIESKIPKIQIFRLIVYKGKRYLLGRNSNGQIYEIDKVQKTKELATFMRKYVIFKLNNNNDEHLQISVDEAIETYILPKLLNKYYKQEKQSIVLGDKLNNNVIQNVLRVGSAQSKQKITKIFLDHNNITDTSFVAKTFKNLQILQLSHNSIRKFDELSVLTNLKSLSLSNSGIDQIPQCLFSIKNLQQLCLSHNSISVLDTSVQRLQKLKILQLSHNILQEIPESIGKCLQLIILRCQNNKLKRLPQSIGQLQSLRTLYLKNNEIQEIPIQFGQLGLWQLDLSSNQLEAIPECFGQLKYLQNLDISNNRIIKVNENINNMSELTTLNLQSNKNLESFPNTFASIKKLQVLYLNKCSFTEVPWEITQIKTLRQLFLVLNSITRIRKQLGNLWNLEVLDLSNNQIISDDAFKDICLKLVNLRRINLSHNHISKFPNFFFCQSIVSIDISYNNLQEMESNDLAGLNNLQYLNISHNNINKLTNSIVFIKNLKQFDLSFNKIKEIESEDNMNANIVIWPQITRINLQNNELSEVPACLLRSQRMGNLQNLTSINIKSNKVQKLPNQLQGLKKLKQFNCANNNVKHLSVQLKNFMKGKECDLDINQLKLQSNEELTPLKKRLIMSKRDSRNFDKSKL